MSTSAASCGALTLARRVSSWATRLSWLEWKSVARSIKSDGDFEDILAQDDPDVWESHRPAEGGAAGKMLKDIIERALSIGF